MVNLDDQQTARIKDEFLQEFIYNTDFGQWYWTLACKIALISNQKNIFEGNQRADKEDYLGFSNVIEKMQKFHGIACEHARAPSNEIVLTRQEKRELNDLLFSNEIVMLCDRIKNYVDEWNESDQNEFEIPEYILFSIDKLTTPFLVKDTNYFANFPNKISAQQISERIYFLKAIYDKVVLKKISKVSTAKISQKMLKEFVKKAIEIAKEVLRATHFTESFINYQLQSNKGELIINFKLIPENSKA